MYLYIYVRVHFEYHIFPVNFNSDPHILKNGNKVISNNKTNNDRWHKYYFNIKT